MSMTCRLTLPLLILGAIAGTVVAPTAARADRDIRRSVEFLGFSDDGTRFMVRINDADLGDRLSVRVFDTGREDKAYPIDNPNNYQKQREQVAQRHRISDPGVDSPTSPDGRFTMVGFPRVRSFILAVLRGNRMAEFKKIPLVRGDGPLPKTLLKSVWWNSDGRRIVVVLHKALAGRDGLDVDETHPFEFFAGELRFD